MTSTPDDLREKMGDAIRYWLAFGSTARRTVEDVLAAIEAAGWNLVPMEATKEQLENARRNDAIVHIQSGTMRRLDYATLYRLMLAAAPQITKPKP